jgi:predicted SnoaL-like aldol condensation-catalyzing enzyme
MDDVSALKLELEISDTGSRYVDYQHVHQVLAEGNFVLCISEGFLGEDHSAFYDLFRVQKGKLVEHWDTTEIIAPKSEWKNDNGKF